MLPAKFAFSSSGVTRLNFAEPGKRVIYRDTKTPGFCLRVSEHHKTFYAEKKVGKAPARHTIGAFPDMSVEVARGLAQEFLGNVARWKAANYAEDQKPAELQPRRVPERGLTLGEALEQYIAHRKDSWNRPESAEKQIRWQFKRHLSGWSGRLLADISGDQCVDLHMELRDRCGAVSANRGIELFKAIFNWKYAGELVNPAEKVERFTEKPRVRFLDGAELIRFWDALEKDTHTDFKDAVRLLHGTGLRLSNVLESRWEHVKWDAQELYVPLTKNGNPLAVPLLPNTFKVLQDRHKRMGRPEAGFIFPTAKNGASGRRYNLNRRWHEFMTRAKIEDFRLHDLRHNLASHGTQANVPLQHVAKSLGHANTKTTERYAHLATPEHRAALAASLAHQEQAMAQAKRRQKRLTA